MGKLKWKIPGQYATLPPNQTLDDWLISQRASGKNPKQLACEIAVITGLEPEDINKAVHRRCEKLSWSSGSGYVARAISDGLQEHLRLKLDLPQHEAPDADKLLAAYIALHDEMRKFRKTWSDVTARIDSQVPIGIVFTSDWHVGPVGTDLRALEADIDLIVATPNLYAYVGGDAAHNFILSVMAHFGDMETDMRVDDQFILVQRWLERLRPKLIAVGDGNHSWTTKVADDNRIAKICADLRLVYTGFGGMLRLILPGQSYKIYRVHRGRYNSSFNLTHAVKRLYEFAPEPFDVGVIEHGHQPTIEPFERHGLTRLAVRTGSYQIDSDFAREQGLTWTKGTPVVVFDPQVRRMTGFMDLEVAARFLKSEANGR